eukprot:PITA_23420
MFIEDFSKFASPLFDFLAKDYEFIWSKRYQEDLDILKDKLTTAPILRCPNWSLPFHIYVDASHKAIGAALGKVDEKNPYAIYFISYQAFVHTDHVAIKYLMNKPDVNARIIRWLLLLQQIDLTIVDKSVLSPSFADIKNYLVLAQFPPNLSSKEKKKIARKSTPFTWIGGYCFKLGPGQILRRCVREEEVFDILLTYHDGPCGGHFAVKRTTSKMLQVGYYWPTLHQDVKTYTSQHDRCHRMGRPTPIDEMPLQPQVTFAPFDKWCMDFIRPIDPPSKKKIYIIVCTDYLAKWVETKASDQQINGGHLNQGGEQQQEELGRKIVEATWAYNTTWKTNTGFTPYELVFGKMTLLSIEFDYNTLRMAAQLNLDLCSAQTVRLFQFNGLDEFRKHALLHTEVVQLQRKIWHDKNIKEKQFLKGDWELL